MERDTYTKEGLYRYLVSVGAPKKVIDQARQAYELALLDERGKAIFRDLFTDANT